MSNTESQTIIDEYLDHLREKPFPCIAAKAAVATNQASCFVAGHMACPGEDQEILNFLYDFVDAYRNSDSQYNSAAILFQGPQMNGEDMFDALFWKKLQALADLDAKNYLYDARVNSDINAENFSFSIKEEAFYIIGLHPGSSRKARRFKYPAIIFNPHAQFEALRQSGKYSNLKGAIRKRDIAYSGSVNPMLSDFGSSSEVFQYSGQEYDKNWKCPLNLKHAKNEYHSSS